MSIQSKSIKKLLVLKDVVSAEFTEVEMPSEHMPHTVGSLPVYDENGVLLGYIAIYEDASFTGGSA